MRTLLAAVAVLASLVVLQSVSVREAASQDKAAPVKWEYGVISMPLDEGKGRDQYSWKTRSESVVSPDLKAFTAELKVGDVDRNQPDQVRLTLLNHFGSSGWELAAESTTTLPPRRVFTFKRRLP